jgi:hypothetical protein
MTFAWDRHKHVKESNRERHRHVEESNRDRHIHIEESNRDRHTHVEESNRDKHKLDLIFGVLAPLSTIFQLYHGDQF